MRRQPESCSLCPVIRREGPERDGPKPRPGEENVPSFYWGDKNIHAFRPDEESPPVDVLLMHRYVVGALSEEEGDKVEDLIRDYRPWVVAYQDELREAGLFHYPGEERPVTYRRKSER